METLDLFERLGLALAIGLLIGLERGWKEREGPPGSRTAGIRTFALVGLLGGLWGAMTPALGPIPLAAVALAFAGAFTLFQWREAVAQRDFSVTSTIAGFVVFGLGAYSVLGDTTVAAAAGVVTLVLLAARTYLHEFLRKLTWPELRSAVVLLAMTFLLLPVLPNRTVDPWDTFNPYELWLMTVLIAVLSFAGYVAIRLLGTRRGLILSSAAGSLVSSTTVTLVNARLAAKGGGQESGMLAVGICIAWITSLVRMSAIAVVVNPAMGAPLSAPILAALSVLLIALLILYRRQPTVTGGASIPLDNPLDLSFVLRFGVLLTFVTVVAKLANMAFGQTGFIAFAGVSGFVDVDPITLSASRLAGGAVTVAQAGDAILIAAAANLVTKLILPLAVGGWRFGIKLAMVGALAIGAGMSTWALTANGA